MEWSIEMEGNDLLGDLFVSKKHYIILCVKKRLIEVTHMTFFSIFSLNKLNFLEKRWLYEI